MTNDIFEQMEMIMASHSLDISMDYLNRTLKEKGSRDKRERAMKINNLTMLVSRFVRENCASVTEVKKLLPLLKRAYKVVELINLPAKNFLGDYPVTLQENIQYRIDNLEDYLSGLPQRLDPRMAEMMAKNAPKIWHQ